MSGSLLLPKGPLKSLGGHGVGPEDLINKSVPFLFKSYFIFGFAVCNNKNDCIWWVFLIKKIPWIKDDWFFSVGDVRLYRNIYFLPVLSSFSFAQSRRDRERFKVPPDTWSGSHLKSESRGNKLLQHPQASPWELSPLFSLFSSIMLNYR